MQFFEKETIIRDQTIRLFSLDNVGWFSCKEDAINKQKAHKRFLREMGKSLRRKGLARRRRTRREKVACAAVSPKLQGRLFVKEFRAHTPIAVRKSLEVSGDYIVEHKRQRL